MCTNTTTEIEQLKSENAALWRLCQEQAEILELLQAVAENSLVVDREALRKQLPALMDAPAPSKGAFIRLLADTGPDGTTKQTWTGLQLGAEMKLAKATRDRLVGPLERAGIVEAVETSGRHATRYRLRALINHTLLERMIPILVRSRSVLNGQPAVTPSGYNTLSERTTLAQNAPIRSESVQTGVDTLSEREDALVCMYVLESDLDIQINEEHTNRDPNEEDHLLTPEELQILKPYLREMGISGKILKRFLHERAERILGCILHIKDSKNVRSQSGVLIHMLTKHDPLQPKYLDRARKILGSSLESEEMLVEPTDPEFLAFAQQEADSHCTRCEGKGWYQTWNPIDPWQRCPCHHIPQEPTPEEQTELKSRAKSDCRHCAGQGWTLASLDPETTPWQSCFCTNHSTAKPPRAEASPYPTSAERVSDLFSRSTGAVPMPVPVYAQ